MKPKLRSGYSTGTHATAIVGAVLNEYIYNYILKNIKVILPKNNFALIEVNQENKWHFSSIKTDNDDIDVTKGCCIHAKLYKQKPNTLKEQNASIVQTNNINLFLYAGDGVGVVRKKGLKIEPSYPAINPVPLNMIKLITQTIVTKKTKDIHIVIEVDDGINIATKTANSKVGVIGGISILGTRGIVKPISSSAYINSIQAEIDVINANGYENIVFTLGNTALDWAKKQYEAIEIVEIGNFIYDASRCLKNTNIKQIIFITSVAKMCKVAQGFKNTHNRYGSIDFNIVKKWVRISTKVDLSNEEFLTLKAVIQTLEDEKIVSFIDMLNKQTVEMFKQWLKQLDIDIKSIKIITIEKNKAIQRSEEW